MSSKQVRQSQHSRGLQGQTHLGRIAGGSIHKIRGITQIITLRGGSVLESFYRSHFQPLPPWFRLVGRWRTEAVRLLTKPRNTQARRQCRSQWAKEFSRWLQYDMKKRAACLSQLKKRRNPMSEGQENPSQSSSERLHRFNQEFTSHRTRSVRFGKLPLDARKRAPSFVVI